VTKRPAVACDASAPAASAKMRSPSTYFEYGDGDFTSRRRAGRGASRASRQAMTRTRQDKDLCFAMAPGNNDDWDNNDVCATRAVDQEYDAGDRDQGPLPLGIKLDDKYFVRRLLGRGSMGLVYLGDDPQLERQVAIKVLAPRYAADERVAKRFRREAVAMASVRAENVVQIFSYGDYGSHPYFVMEYIPGYTVAGLIRSANDRGEHLYLDVVLGILRQVCKGLHAVHERGIVHRDVKPPNMLIGPHFKVAITDFGLVETTEEAGATRDLAGTPLYLAPELIRRQSIADSQRHLCDIYALGVSTYEMLTGDVPFDGATVKEILRKHLTDAPVKVSEVRSDLPAAVDEVLDRSLDKDPGKRYTSCLAFMEALDAARTETTRNAPRTGTIRILIADDDAEARTIFGTALKVGFPDAIIHTARDGLQALELARTSRPDLIVADLSMPGMNGLELCATLRGDELTADIPIIVATAHLDADVRAVLKQVGIPDIVRKPVELTDLVSLVRARLQH